MTHNYRSLKSADSHSKRSSLRHKRKAVPSTDADCLKCGDTGWIQACDGPDGFEEPCECSTGQEEAGQ